MAPKISIERRGTDGSQTHRWSEGDSNRWSPHGKKRHLRDREGTGTLREGPKVRISLAQSRLKMVGKVGLSAFASRGPARIIPPRARRAGRAPARPAA